MRRLVIPCVVAALVLLRCGALVQAEEKDTYQPPRNAKKAWWWPFSTQWDWWNAPERDTVAKEPKPPKPKKVENPIEASTQSPIVQEKSVSTSREQAKFIRRQQVCDRLREVAQETGNVSLEKQAQLLEQRAWYVYEQKTVQARLPTLTPLETTASAKKLMNDEPVSRSIPGDRQVRSVSAKQSGKTNPEED